MPSVRIRMRHDQLQLDFGEGNKHIAEKFMRSFHNGQVPAQYRHGQDTRAFENNPNGEVPKQSKTRPYILRFPTYVAEDGDRGINFGSEQARNGFLSALKKLAGRREQQRFDWLKTFPGDPTLSNALYIRSQYLDPEFRNESGVGVEIAQFPHRRVSQRIGPPVVPEPSADGPNPAADPFQLLSALGLHAVSAQTSLVAQHQPAYQQQPAHNPAANASAPPQVNNPQLQHLNALLKLIEKIAPTLKLQGSGTTIPNQKGEEIKLSSSLAKVYEKAQNMRTHIESTGHRYPGDEIRQRLIQPMQKRNKKTQMWETKEAGGKGPWGGKRDSTTTDHYNDVIAMLEKAFNLTPPLASAPAYPQPGAVEPGAGVPAIAAPVYGMTMAGEIGEQVEGQTPGATSSGPSAPAGLWLA
ncbi:hypothetical protein PsalMR5_03954 [Piscirickettsia salmonis]|uniref:hypothetical protein n=1 Tax=Piscirickettsia salmonis TaxID=1238 RepID=UPI0012BB0464|nr:hypothetical protein [Piscirickettsia salmonis]QGP56470.1 hypothetical protein PsalSR1_03954 [Piscirickettsia salmonis]QGP61268.1 hypothetical protein PsalBI1_03905 [Piscirickettsia salmonis]QGP66034.1 hypothetical protein PsalMR5_03954 [Piscirickettsia salmonis]